MKQRKNNLLIICAALILSLIFSFAIVSSQKNIARGEQVQEQSSYASSMVVIESSTNRILYQQRAFDRRPMASTTKILTAITVLENTADITKIVKVPSQCAGIEGSSIYLAAGEEISIENLLYGLMLQSGNDCAETLAVVTAGSLGKFAELMNQTAKKAGAQNSNFVTPHGLHHDDHYTTAYDLALISSYAMKNQDFRTIVATKMRKMPWAGRDYPRMVANKNKILFNFEGGNGIKTGYTKKAGRCLVASAKRDEMEVISVVLNCGPMFEECSVLMNRAFSDYKMVEVLPAHHSIGEINVTNSKKKTIKVFSLEPRYYPLKQNELSSITTITELPDKVSAPVSLYQEVGKIKVYFASKLLYTQSIYAMEEAQSTKVRDNLKDILQKWFKVG